MTFVFVHLTGSHRGRTDRFHALPVTLGTSPEADVRFSGKDRKVQPEHARVVGQNGGYRIQAGPGAALLVNGVPVESAQLLEGDLVQVGEGGPRLRFRVRARVRRHKAVREMWSDCRDVAGQCRGRLSYAGTLARQVWREG
ncbi:MAG: FHA domain-containing protein, partial [Acidobacteria bacterium]|nr:FHA domain-containing protein [Acidobacteriota bacterium]